MTPIDETEPRRFAQSLLTRRRLLVLVSATATSALLSACMNDDDEDDATAVIPGSVPPTTDVDEEPPSPEPGGSLTAEGATETTPTDGATETAPADATGTAPAGSVTLEQFMQMSGVLTAFEGLDDTDNGETYLTALNRDPEFSTALGELWDQGGFAEGQPASAVNLEAAGIYDDETLANLADTITRYWYTGIYSTGPDTTEVATFTEALAWQALTYRGTGPTTCSGAFGSWATAPTAA